MRWWVLALSVLSFIVTAKTHGRQVRLERELAGYQEFQFGGSNPPFVEALWKRERIGFWSVTLFLALAWLIFGVRTSAWSVLIPPVLWAPSLAFAATGIASLVRYFGASRTEMSAEWVSSASWGNAGWWALSAAVLGATAILTRQWNGLRWL
jgi:hypothetical protein